MGPDDEGISSPADQRPRGRIDRFCGGGGASSELVDISTVTPRHGAGLRSRGGYHHAHGGESDYAGAAHSAAPPREKRAHAHEGGTHRGRCRGARAPRGKERLSSSATRGEGRGGARGGSGAQRLASFSASTPPTATIVAHRDGRGARPLQARAVPRPQPWICLRADGRLSVATDSTAAATGLLEGRQGAGG